MQQTGSATYTVIQCVEQLEQTSRFIWWQRRFRLFLIAIWRENLKVRVCNKPRKCAEEKIQRMSNLIHLDENRICEMAWCWVASFKLADSRFSLERQQMRLHTPFESPVSTPARSNDAVGVNINHPASVDYYSALLILRPVCCVSSMPPCLHSTYTTRQ
jgi:hypothetical protein